jgi:putative chitinase
MNELITETQMAQICPKLSKFPIRIKSLTSLLNSICPIYGINTKDIFHEFFANLCEESGEFLHLEENLSYSIDRMLAVWPTRFKSAASAKPYARNPKALAMKVYGGRKDLGNLTPEDGWLFRGGGPIQLTGRANFTNFARWMEKKFGIVKAPEVWADLLRTNDEYGIHSACWIFAIAMGLNDEAERDEMKTIVKRINGGLTNYPQRIHYYELAKKYII